MHDEDEVVRDFGKPEDYFFMHDKENDCYCFVSKDYWAENHCMEDSNYGGFEDLLPDGFLETMEWTWDYSGGDYAEAVKELTSAGFTEMPYAW